MFVILYYISKAENEFGEKTDEKMTMHSLAELDTSYIEDYSSAEAINKSTPIEKLNGYLASTDISPVRHTLTVPWEEVSERTKRHYVRKGREVVNACLEEIVPGESAAVLDCLVKDKLANKTDYNLAEALNCKYFQNSCHWGTRRQILSIIANKVSFKELKMWIPDLTRYHFNIARHHKLLHGAGFGLPTTVKNTRMYLDIGKLDHFLTFISSTHIVQDLPFGEKSSSCPQVNRYESQTLYAP